MTDVLRLPDRTLTFAPGRPLVMGIVNTGPDSFSDAVRRTTLAAQLEHALALVADGADLIDVGGESGVTYTGATTADVEIARVVPLVERLTSEGVLVSVDTWKPAVARAAVAAGAAIINDVSGLRDLALADVAAATGAGLVVMHTRVAPKQAGFPEYRGGVVADVLAFLRERCARAVQRGVAQQQFLVDPGPDFAKRPQESVEVLRALAVLRAELGRPVLAAVSRKYFLGAINGRDPHDRLAGTLAAVAHAAAAGAAVLRVHDVAAVVDFLATQRVLAGAEDVGAFDAEDERLNWIRSAG
jgi:dihydropteroate synthase